MDSIWGNDPGVATDNDWFSMKTVFTDAGYRDGVMAGKESALQEGFDDGFASAAASSGRELGVLRGIASALLSFIVSYSSYRLDQDSLVKEARLIQSNLADIRFADIILRDVDSERHARQHSNSAVFGTTITADRPAMDDARQLKKQLQDLTRRLGLTISLD